MYRIVKANKRDQIAYAQFVEDVLLPEIDEEIFSKIGLMLQNGASIDSILAQTGQNDKSKRKVGIYSTHSSESYIPSDGAEASESKGGYSK